MSKTIVITSGYFNPLHPWHIECFEACKELGDEVWVIVNNDEQARMKTGKQEVFQDEKYRMIVISALKSVDRAMLSVDTDGSVCKSISLIATLIREQYGNDTKILFGKWWDKFADNIPEVEVCKQHNIEIKDGLGSKIDNSSEYRAKIISETPFL